MCGLHSSQTHVGQVANLALSKIRYNSLSFRFPLNNKPILHKTILFILIIIVKIVNKITLLLFLSPVNRKFQNPQRAKDHATCTRADECPQALT